MLGLSVHLTGVVFLIVIPMMVCIFSIRYAIRKLFSAHRAKVSNRTAFVVETIMGEKIVKSYNRTHISEQIYDEVHNASVVHWYKILKLSSLNHPLVEFFWNLGTACLYGVALYLILNGSELLVSSGVGVLVISVSTVSVLNAGNIMTDMTHELTVITVVGIHPLSGEETELHQSSIYHGTCVTLGENKPVAVLPLGVLGIDVHFLKVQISIDFCGRQAAAGMACLCAVSGLNYAHTNLAGSDLQLLLFTGSHGFPPYFILPAPQAKVHLLTLA